MKPRLRSILLCDEIRQELNLKRFLIGVFNEKVISSTRPAPLALEIYAVFDGVDEGVTLEFELSLGQRKRRSSIAVPPRGDWVNVTLPVRVLLTTADELVFRWRAGRVWSNPYTWQLTFTDNPLELPEEEQVRLQEFAAANQVFE